MLSEQYDIEREDENEGRGECDSCKGTGVIDVGDCEDGVEEECPTCMGEGFVDEGDGIALQRKRDLYD